MGAEQILVFLGERPPTTGGDPFLVADVIAGGLHRDAIQRVKAALDLSDAQLAAVIGMSQRTISRMRKNPDPTLGPVVSDRLYRLGALFSLARDVLGGDGEAREWHRAPQIGLNNRVPLDLLTTEVGAREVENLLGRIEYGVLS